MFSQSISLFDYFMGSRLLVIAADCTLRAPTQRAIWGLSLDGAIAATSRTTLGLPSLMRHVSSRQRRRRAQLATTRPGIDSSSYSRKSPSAGARWSIIKMRSSLPVRPHRRAGGRPQKIKRWLPFTMHGLRYQEAATDGQRRRYS